MRKKFKAMGAVESVNSTDSIQRTPPSESKSEQMQMSPLPLDTWEEIFMNLPPRQVVCVCRLVSHQWKELADSESFWKERSRRDGYYFPNSSVKDWRLFYFVSMMKRNLLKNPRAESSMDGWQILENGGDRWAVERPMKPHPNEAVSMNFVTSYGMCKKAQLIDLKKEGYSPAFMDTVQPHIQISDWYAPRWDCASEYHIEVQLLNAKKATVQSFAPDTVVFEQWNEQQWTQMTHVFKDYGPGVRYIRFIHGGKDRQFWAGWYGIRVTDSCVELCSGDT